MVSFSVWPLSAVGNQAELSSHRLQPTAIDEVKGLGAQGYVVALEKAGITPDQGDILVTDEFDVPVVLDESVAEELETAVQAVSEENSDENETEEDENA